MDKPIYIRRDGSHHSDDAEFVREIEKLIAQECCIDWQAYQAAKARLAASEAQ